MGSFQMYEKSWKSHGFWLSIHESKKMGSFQMCGKSWKLHGFWLSPHKRLAFSIHRTKIKLKTFCYGFSCMLTKINNLKLFIIKHLNMLFCLKLFCQNTCGFTLTVVPKPGKRFLVEKRFGAPTSTKIYQDKVYLT